MGRGMPAGTAMPIQELYSYPPSPASPRVGTSAAISDRLEPVTTRARNFPALIAGICVTGLSIGRARTSGSVKA